MLSEAARAFYRERNRRRDEYLAGAQLGTAPVFLSVGKDALRAAPGQLLVFTLLNLLARAHRRVAIHLAGGDVERQIDLPFGGERMVGASLIAIASAIDPWGEFDLLNEMSDPSAVVLGVGSEGVRRVPWYVGADRALGTLAASPVPITNVAASARGAGTSACLGAASIFLRQLGHPVVERVLSAWNWAEGAAAAPGLGELAPIDVGDVLMVGAGAVGSATAYWSGCFGSASRWAIVEGDEVELHNTDRGLLFTAAHAGWPGGILGGTSAAKAGVAAAWLPNATPHPYWYDQSEAVVNARYDVVLALANERSVRQLLAARHSAVALQATTGEHFLAQVHRHIAGRDDCVACRTGRLAPPRLGCSTESIPTPDGGSVDAALPFLSAASGLMLVTAMHRLQAGDLADEPRNRWDWRFSGSGRAAGAGRHVCHEGCPNLVSAAARARLVSSSRWASLVR